MSKTDICNMALAYIGHSRPIASLAEGTTESRMCDTFYEIARKSLLMEYPWSFAKKSYILLSLAGTTDTTTLVFTPETNEKYSYVYKFPNDALRILSIKSGNEPDGINNNYEITYALGVDTESRHTKRIVCDIASARAEYIYDLQDADAYTPTFADALAWKIAAMIGVSMSKDVKVAQNAAQMQQSAIEKAKLLEARQQHKPLNRGNRYLDARK